MLPPKTRPAGLIFSLAVVAFSQQAAFAHLCIVRQGPESAGAIESGDIHGKSVATGDFNGDGFVDMAVGAPNDSVGTANGAGAVVISYGCPTGITQVGAQVLTQTSLGFTSELNDAFGYSLAVGNFNNDAYDDLAIGAPGESIDFHDDAGNVMIVLGSPSGLLPTGLILSQGNSPGLVEAGDIFGFALATGDFNGDDFDDLAVGIPGEDLEIGALSIDEAGAIEIYFGGSSGITTAGAYIITDNDTLNPAAAGALMGWALASGDFDDSGEDDLAVGLPGKNTSGVANHGVIEVLYGSATGIGTADAQLFSQVSFGGGNEAGDRFGQSLAAGNPNGDAFDDIAVGTPLKGSGDNGRFYVAYGSTTGITTMGAQSIGQTVSSPGDNFGYALAFGRYDTDAFDDLAVGIPGQTNDAGAIRIFFGNETGVAAFSGTITKTQETLNEVSESGDRLGEALAFGAFAGGSREGIAIGAPGEDWDPLPGDTSASRPDAGAVYIDLPWKQVQNLTSRSCMLTTCDDEIAFSQKPFEPHLLASTSKIMTLLLACESVQQGCNPCSNLNNVYTVPAVVCNRAIWTGGSIGGSLANLCPGETITLNNLLRAMMYPSGNDAAFSIADFIVNPNSNCVDTTCQDIFDFVDMMNARAAQIGMSVTNFENPSGGAHPSWPSQNVASANDMARLAFTAMQNPLFRQVVGGTSFTATRFGTCLGGNGVTNTTWNTGVYIMPGGQGPDFPNASGIKPGGTPAAGNTLVCSVDHPDGRYFGVILGEPNGGSMRTDMTALLQFGSSEYCNLPLTLPPTPPGSNQSFPGISTAVDSATTIQTPLDESPDRAWVLRATVSPGSGPATADLRLCRTVQVNLAPGEATTLRVQAFESHGGVNIQNIHSERADIRVQHTHPAIDVSMLLSPGDDYVIPAFAAAGGAPEAVLKITNTSSIFPAMLEISELDIAFSLNLTPGGPAFEVRLETDVLGGEDYVLIKVEGLDAGDGSSIDLSVSNTFADDPGCDGAFDINDLDAFVKALLGSTEFAVDYPSCYYGSADINGDGYVDGRDVGPFVQLLVAP
ncbi:MAG: FG-GAP repeat protein [Phycisphaerales bacterium]|nr:FG-GAP repeat protein [Phycisphaerales bacterium]MCB9857348.1 FG-GAP repeat protein [Phycisphaerales bacterium]